MKTLIFERTSLLKRLKPTACPVNRISFALTLTLLFFCSTLFAQLAPVNPPTGGFAIDGGLRANTPSVATVALPWLGPNQGDWYPGPGGTGGSVFNSAGDPINSLTSGRAVPDPFNGDDNIFTNGSKFNDYISALHWFKNSAPDKNDINNALYHVSRDANNNQWAFIAGDRLSTSGTSYIDFEFLQGTVTETAGGFVGTPDPSKPGGGGRTQNDMVVSMEYTNGGSKPIVYIYQWKLSGTTWSYELATVTNLAANAFAETNRTGAETGLPYSAFGKTSYDQFAFVEAAVNVTYLISQTSGGNACSGLSIKTLWIKTKAAASSTAALKDFVDPIPVNFQFGQAEITPIGAFCVNNTSAQTLTATPAGGSFSGPGVSNGQFTPSVAGVGTHTIMYSYSGCSATTTVTVNALPTISGTLSVCAGSSTQLTGSGTAASSNAWSSSNTAVATVSSSGLVAGLVAGTSTITYTNSNGCQQTALVTVNSLPTISGTLSVCAGSSTQLTGSATAATPNGWSSSNTAVATVSSSGLVAGITSGTSTITYTNSNGCQQTALVTVNPLPTITGNLNVCAGSNTQLTGSASPAASNAWSSSNTAAATVSATGLVHGVSAGSSTITYTNSNGCQQTAIINVNGLPTIGGTLSVCVGSTTQLTGSATAAASNAWSSSNTAVASVSNSGLVSGVSAGSATITYTNSNGCQQTAIVTVNALPLAPQLTVVPPTCGNSNGSVTVTPATDADLVYSNNNGTFQAGASFTVASNAAYSIRVKRLSTGCISAATSGTMGNAVGTPAADVVIQTSPSCTSSTGTLKVVKAAGGDFDITIYEFSSDGLTFGSNPVFTFTAGQGYSITVRKISDHTCSVTTSCSGEASAKTAATSISKATLPVTNNLVTYLSQEQARVTAYPNPFSNTVQFAIESPVAGRASLELYNSTGQKIQTIYQGYLFAGKQQLISYRPSASSGTMIYTLKVGNQRVNGKLVQLRQ